MNVEEVNLTFGQRHRGKDSDKVETCDMWEGLEEGWIMWYMSKGLEEDDDGEEVAAFLVPR
eukprot:47725-Hanusia_phi.AAC.1